MNIIIDFLNKIQTKLNKTLSFNFIAPLLLRIYLVPIFWVAGNNKLSNIDDTINWFGNSDWGLGMPFPDLMAWLATLSEVGGAILLALGLGTRWISIPLMITMLVAAFSVHWHKGWQAVHDLMMPFSSPNAEGAIDRLDRAKDILREHGNYDWLTEHGNFVISNNGIEWAVTYFIMLLALFFLGGGKYVSIDYWIKNKFGK